MLVEQIIEFEWKGYGPPGHKRSQGGPTNPPQLKCYLWKKCGKKAYCLFSFSFF